MSTQAPISVIQNGLVLCLDAANTKSYSGSGTNWTDLSRNSNNGTLTNGPTFSATNLGSIVFDGTDDYVDIANASTLNITTNITLEAWIYPTKNNGIQNVISKSSQSQNTGYIYPRTDNGWATSIFYLHIGGWSTLNASWPSLNAWHYTAGVYDGSKMYIYINGNLAASKNQTGSIATNTNSLALGSQPGYGEYYGGRIGMTRVYNRVLTPSEILQNYNSTKSRFGL